MKQTALHALSRAALVLTALTIGADYTTPIVRAEEPAATEISVSGDAPYVLLPDSALFHVSLEQTSATAQEAAAALDTRYRQIDESLRSAKLPATLRSVADVTARGQAPRGGAALLLRRQVLVTVTETSAVPKVLDLLLRIPGGTTSAPEYLTRDSSAVVTEALTTASARAHDKAAKLASSLGVKLGPLMSAIATEEPEGEAVRQKITGNAESAEQEATQLHLFVAVRYAIDRAGTK